ncbi:MAG: peptidase M10 [Chitinophagaceae bacterium]|nr:peptidase M10 [Chitinophagaceae bacterium]
MGEAELHKRAHQLIIHSMFYFYGEAASSEIAVQIADDISRHWNEPKAQVVIKEGVYDLIFRIEGIFQPDLKPEAVWYNDNPVFNFFRIEEYAVDNISFVDGIGSNTGYFKLDNLLQTSTTAAHEYGHTIGLIHPKDLDIRGGGIPGMMYPRGTICDPEFQYDPTVESGKTGGTLNPVYRKVMQSDIEDLKLHKLFFNDENRGVIGEFSSLYHEKHIKGI